MYTFKIKTEVSVREEEIFILSYYLEQINIEVKEQNTAN